MNSGYRAPWLDHLVQEVGDNVSKRSAACGWPLHLISGTDRAQKVEKRCVASRQTCCRLLKSQVAVRWAVARNHTIREIFLANLSIAQRIASLMC
jgi:hypothetical protein